MYSVSQGLNSGCTNFLVLTRSADLALRHSALWVLIWRSTSRLVLARRADLWIYQGEKEMNTHKIQPQCHFVTQQYAQEAYLTGWSCRANVMCLSTCHACILLPWTIESKRMSSVHTLLPALLCGCSTYPPGALWELWGFSLFGLTCFFFYNENR